MLQPRILATALAVLVLTAWVGFLARADAGSAGFVREAVLPLLAFWIGLGRGAAMRRPTETFSWSSYSVHVFVYGVGFSSFFALLEAVRGQLNLGRLGIEIAYALGTALFFGFTDFRYSWEREEDAAPPVDGSLPHSSL